MKHLFFTVLFMVSANFSYAETSYSIKQAKEDMQAGRYEATIENLRELVDQEQRNYEAWFMLGVAHVHEQQSHQAIEAFRQVIAIRPDLAEPHNNLAAVYNNLGDTNAAVAELEAALEKRPNYTVAEENLADLYVKLALQHYHNALTQSPNPIIEQRYARLVKVRNPMPTAQETQAENNAAEMAGEPTAMEMENAEPAAVSDTEPMQASDTPEPVSEAPLVSAPKEATITDVLDALETWRRAWAGQNLEAYFATYAADFDPGARFDSQAAWKNYKTRVIKNKTFIEIHLEQVEVTFNADKSVSTIMMLQRFRSNSYNGDDFKKIRMVHTPQGWKITHEASIT